MMETRIEAGASTNRLRTGMSRDYIIIRDQGRIMKAIVSIYTACILLLVLVTASESAAVLIGPKSSYEPIWKASAQVRLGWEFTDPRNPGPDAPLTGWNTAGGNSVPSWSYSFWQNRGSGPAQWNIRVPNVSALNISNDFWFCVVYNYNKYYTGPGGNPGHSIYSSIEGDPAFTHSTVLQTYPEQYLDANGAVVDAAVSTYARFTQRVRIAPNLNGEYLWIGLPRVYYTGYY